MKYSNALGKSVYSVSLKKKSQSNLDGGVKHEGNYYYYNTIKSH